MINDNFEKIEPIDLTHLLSEYSKMWVVLSFDETKVIKSGNSYDEISDVSDQGITMLVPDYELPYAP